MLDRESRFRRKGSGRWKMESSCRGERSDAKREEHDICRAANGEQRGEEEEEEEQQKQEGVNLSSNNEKEQLLLLLLLLQPDGTTRVCTGVGRVSTFAPALRAFYLV